MLRRTGLLRPALRSHERAKALRYSFQDRRSSPDGLPLPPARLRVLVGHRADARRFLRGGAADAANLRETLERNGIRFAELGSALDFGCGCGRIARHLRDLPLSLHGCDYNEAAARWCDQSLDFMEARVNDLAPPLPYDDDSFGLVYAWSVFTHFSPDLQLPWIGELRRVARPGGYIYLTVHGDRFTSDLSEEERRRFDAGELIVQYEELAGMNRCSAFHPQEWMDSQFAADGLELIDRVPGGLRNRMQDIYLLRLP